MVDTFNENKDYQKSIYTPEYFWDLPKKIRDKHLSLLLSNMFEAIPKSHRGDVIIKIGRHGKEKDYDPLDSFGCISWEYSGCIGHSEKRSKKTEIG